MKKKITISLEESILERLDKTVKSWEGKNRSSVIEDILKEKYWEFADVTVIIFGHDRKWDNRQYPFTLPKPLLEIRKRTIADRQVDSFTKTGIKNIIYLIEPDSTQLFEDELLEKYPQINFDFVEIDPKLKTGEALKIWLKRKNTTKNIIIANGDIFYWNLDIEEYYNYHKEQNWDLSMLLKFVLNPEQLWNVAIHGNKIVWFVDRPKAKHTYLTNSGLYLTTRDFLDKQDFWNYIEHTYFPKIVETENVIWYVYSWEWEHIQNDSAYERVNGWLM